MFSKKSPVEYNNVNTIIGEDCSFEGRLSSKGSIRVDGTINGEINVESNLYVGEKGKVLGNVHGSSIFIAGEVHGNVYVVDQLRISSSGKLYGDVDVKTFILDEDAMFEGSCRMHKHKEAADKLDRTSQETA